MPKEKVKKTTEKGLTVFLFGAGASAGTFPKYPKKIPTAQEFGAFLKRQRGGLKLFPAIKKAVLHLKPSTHGVFAFTLEEVWTAFDFYAKLERALPARKPWRDESRNIKRAILRVYGKHCDRLAQGLPLDASYTLGQLFENAVKPGDTLVSFNYDTLVERVAKRFGHKLSVANSGCTSSKKAVLLTKPHGSVSWAIDFKKRTVKWHENGLPLFESLSEKVVAKKREPCEPLVLGTVPIKSELIREVQCHIPEIFSVVVCQWKALIDALIKADTVVMVGYSFPREDLYGRFLIKEAVRKRKTRKRKTKLNIQYFELPDKAPEISKEIVSVFGDEIACLEYMGEVKPHR